VREAARDGADFVALPENYFFIGPLEAKVAQAQTLDGPRVMRLGQLAKELNIHLLAGSIAEKSADADRCFNTSLFFGPDGSLLNHYRKLHLFDIDIPNGAQFQESATVVPGDEGLTLVQTPLATFGLSICYDLRFPKLYRALANQGAQVLTVPSAFTQFTGKDHWEVLLRARAIENTAWVVAPNHWGQHSPSRASYGRSMIIDPWGNVVARCPDAVSYATARIHLDLLDEVRQQLPCLQHQRL
jgi:predicted amidohydrolase